MKRQANLGIDWDSEPRLGAMSDRKLADLVGCHYTNVRAARIQRGIPPFRSSQDIESDKRKIRELAKRFKRQTDVAEITGFHNSYISRVLNGKV